MVAIPGLTPGLDRAVRDELRPGEELWYAGMPKPWLAARKALPIAVFGCFFGGFAAFWIAGAAGIAWSRGADSGGTDSASSAAPAVVDAVALLFPLFGLPFLLIGMAMILAPWWIARGARRTACCVTNERALEIRAGRGVSVRSWSADEIGGISKTIHSDGRGTLLFASSTFTGSKGRTRTAREGFHGVPEPRTCEEALLALAERASGRGAPEA